jgi:hypothetical protein
MKGILSVVSELVDEYWPESTLGVILSTLAKTGLEVASGIVNMPEDLVNQFVSWFNDPQNPNKIPILGPLGERIGVTTADFIQNPSLDSSVQMFAAYSEAFLTAYGAYQLTSSNVAASGYNVNDTFRGGKFREITLKPGTQLQRVFQEGVNDPVGSFTTRGATVRRISSTASSDTAIQELGLKETSQVRPNRLTTLELTKPTPAKIGFIKGGGENAIQVVIDRANLGNIRQIPGSTIILK